MKKIIFCALMGSILHGYLFAQAPQGLNYQAVARNSSGVILNNQNVSIRLTITDGNAGAVLYQETHAALTNQFGLFTLSIGNGIPMTGTFSSIPWSSAAPWLQVELDPTGGSSFVNMGTSQLLSVPYALYAASGNQGPVGPQGATGPQGPQGATGPQGLQGDAGLQGPQGATGPQGLQGATGATGPQGPQGATGATGPQGLQGLTGATGAQGSQGPTGAQGPQGVAGPQGPAGADGDRYSTVSVTSMTITLGAHTFTAEAGLSYGVAQTVIIANDTDKIMTGEVVSYNSLTGAMVVDVTSIVGSGTYVSWSIALNGAAGPAGPIGATGATGPTGPSGTNGAIWYTGSGAPAGGVGAINDLYLNTSNGNYYKKTGASTWTLQANLTGPQGIQGTTGATGATGAAGPQGATGAQGATGVQGPQGATGATGASGTNGATWYTGTGSPATGTGVVNDLYLNTTNGDYYKKTGASTWTLQANLTGPQGPQGPAGSGGGSIAGTTNYLIKFTSSSAGGNSLLYDDGTNVGIGTTSPSNALDVTGNIRAGNFLKVDGSNLNNGTLNTGLLFGSSGTEGIASNRASITNKYGLDFYTRSTKRMSIDSTGRVGIGITPTVYKLDVAGGARITGDYIDLCQSSDNSSGNVGIGAISYDNVKLAVASSQKYGLFVDDPTSPSGFAVAINGTAAKTGGGSWAVYSDARLKDHVHQFNDGLNLLMKIKPVTYHYNEASGFNTKLEYVGVIAQELKEVAPYMVNTFSSLKDGKEYYSVDNSAMTYMLINAVKEQQKQIEELKEEIRLLKQK